MAGSVLGIAFSLILLVSIIQGVKNAELLFSDTVEAEVGQNITITCFKDLIGAKIVDVKWMKDGGTKLAVYNMIHKGYQFLPNVTIQAETVDEKDLISADLHISWVSKWNSGTYTCEINTFPSGSFTSETKLTVRDEIKVLCNADKVVEVYFGDNAAIRCTVNSNANYTWTKNNKLVSENETLELRKVTEDHAGVYKLTVNTGYKTLYNNFTIHVLATNIILRTDATESTQGPSDSPHTSTATPLTTILPTDMHWTTQPNSSTVIVPAARNVTPSITLTSSHDTQTDPLLNSSISNYDVTVLTSTQRMSSNEMKNESSFNIQSTRNISSVSTEETSTAESILSAGHTGGPSTDSETSVMIEKETERSHMLLVFIIVLLLLLIVVVFILYRKQLIKKRMDLPPPFKPPPPPVKYTAARRSETQLFPTSRCNSISAPMGPISI